MLNKAREDKVSFMEKIQQKLEKKFEDEGGELDTGFHHSTNYHDFFEGYAEAYVPNSNGKGSHIERVYIGNYYTQDISKRKRVELRLLYITLYLLSVFLFAYGMVQQVPSNSSLFVAAPGLVSVMAFILLLPVLISYVTQPRNMTIWGYRSSSGRIRKFTLVAAGLVLLTAIAVIANCVISAQDDLGGELVCILCYFLSSTFMGVIGFVERKINYVVAPSVNSPSEDEIIIR